MTSRAMNCSYLVLSNSAHQFVTGHDRDLIIDWYVRVIKKLVTYCERHVQAAPSDGREIKSLCTKGLVPCIKESPDQEERLQLPGRNRDRYLEDGMD